MVACIKFPEEHALDLRRAAAMSDPKNPEAYFSALEQVESLVIFGSATDARVYNPQLPDGSPLFVRAFDAFRQAPLAGFAVCAFNSIGKARWGYLTADGRFAPTYFRDALSVLCRVDVLQVFGPNRDPRIAQILGHQVSVAKPGLKAVETPVGALCPKSVNTRLEAFSRFTAKGTPVPHFVVKGDRYSFLPDPDSPDLVASAEHAVLVLHDASTPFEQVDTFLAFVRAAWASNWTSKLTALEQQQQQQQQDEEQPDQAAPPPPPSAPRPKAAAAPASRPPPPPPAPKREKKVAPPPASKREKKVAKKPLDLASDFLFPALPRAAVKAVDAAEADAADAAEASRLRALILDSEARVSALQAKIDDFTSEIDAAERSADWADEASLEELQAARRSARKTLTPVSADLEVYRRRLAALPQ
jgi:outer membrane biosynthesis protein TonB